MLLVLKQSWMPPWLVETAKVLLWGSQSGWFGLACPAHCSSSLPLLLSVFVSGFGLGALLVIGCLWTSLRPFPFDTSSFVAPSHFPTPSVSRLAGYLHERKSPSRRGH